ncbi:Small-conductance mechanosensitive channel [Vibrio vulnificus]|nr:Small-conductance mechanosensitive channel [Vibrio vulnificus]
MPLLGYMGYVPFGILVWQVLIWSGKIMGINTDLREVTDWYLISEQKAQFDTPCRAEV